MKEQTHIETDGIKIWIDSGILYIEYSKKLTLDVFIESQTLGLDLVTKNGLDIVPLIIIYQGEARDGIELSMLDVGKLMSTVNVYHHLSCILVVNAGEAHKKIGDMLNKFIMKGRLRFVESLAAAQAEAKQELTNATRILEA